MRVTYAVAGAVMTIVLFLSGCIWLDDDDCCCCHDLTEHIIYINNTGYLVDNYIDGDYVGTIPAYGELSVWGDYEDEHEYYSVCRDCECDIHWGPTVFDLRDGEVFRIYLEPDHWAWATGSINRGTVTERFPPSF